MEYAKSLLGLLGRTAFAGCGRVRVVGIVLRVIDILHSILHLLVNALNRAAIGTTGTTRIIRTTGSGGRLAGACRDVRVTGIARPHAGSAGNEREREQEQGQSETESQCSTAHRCPGHYVLLVFSISVLVTVHLGLEVGTELSEEVSSGRFPALPPDRSV